MDNIEIKVGDIYWLKNQEGISHPQLVVDIKEKLTVCSLTTNIKKANLPGNVLLKAGEGNLEKISIVEVSKVLEIEKSLLDKYIGSLSDERVSEIKNGIGFLERTYFKK